LKERPNVKLKKKHFDIFRKTCEKWAKIYGLLDWDILYHFDNDLGTNAARCDVNHDGRVAWITLNCDANLTITQVKQFAFHEMTELLLAELQWLMEERFIDQAEVNVARHRVINVLQKVLYPKY